MHLLRPYSTGSVTVRRSINPPRAGRCYFRGGNNDLALKFESAPPRKGECIFLVKSRQRDRLEPPDTPLSHLVSDTGSANHTINARFFRRVKILLAPKSSSTMRGISKVVLSPLEADMKETSSDATLVPNGSVHPGTLYCGESRLIFVTKYTA